MTEVRAARAGLEKSTNALPPSANGTRAQTKSSKSG
jgi:hypothetical protein